MALKQQTRETQERQAINIVPLPAEHNSIFCYGKSQSVNSMLELQKKQIVDSRFLSLESTISILLH
ncbi:MAG TPA: hypothetical protein DCY03_06995 [Planctomycetaceae bacterium]|nr:hypothetical protein [Planctomycetaceae bacterium]